MVEFSAEEHMFRKTIESMLRSRPLPQDNLLPPVPMAYEGYNAFQGYEGPWPSKY